MRVCLIALSNGVGLSRDLQLIAAALAADGCEVTVQPLRRGKLRKWFRPVGMRARQVGHRLLGRERPYDVNLMLEHIRPEFLGQARLNAFIPNPEHMLPSDRALLPRIDHILVKTRHAERIFREVGRDSRYIGFTSEDRWLPQVPRERAFFHLAGRSSAKGTETVLETWRAHPEWPRLTVVQNPRLARPQPPAPNIEHIVDYLDDAELKRLQNAHRFHLCPSETEGFGHYLMEALSVGAVTLATDGEPMNELVTAERGLLLPAEETCRRNLARAWRVRREEIEAGVVRALALSDAECEAIGRAARRHFEHGRQSFGPMLAAAMRELSLEQPARAQPVEAA